MSILDQLQSRQDLCALTEEQTAELCRELREQLVQTVAKNGGHLAANLGVVELTVAIHRSFDTSKDRLVFDVGHQSYVHKLLTDRRDRFSTLRQFGGVAGFPKPGESVHDAFIAGHASASVSAALGMARARTLQGEDYHVLALMGDGALTGGLAYEGLNDAGESKEPLIIILNDNGMSITKNVGGMAKHLATIRTRASYFRLKKLWRSMTKSSRFGRFLYRRTHIFKERLKRSLIGSNMFEEMGFDYLGPTDGHDISKMCYLFERAKELNGPVVVHVLTKKGRGYEPAEKNPDLFHGVSGFDPATGEIPAPKYESFSDVFGDALTGFAANDPKLCAITAAMQSGTGLDLFAQSFPERFFDVGIAEGHAVTMASGMAKQGMLPVVAIYSTFLQRAYDMLLHDTAIQHLHVVFVIDRAGLVGNDGETHHGVFDAGFLRQIPGMTVLCPASLAELKEMLRRALYEIEGPVAVRFPKGGEGRYTGISETPVLKKGKDLTLCGYGRIVNELLAAADLLAQEGVDAEVVKLSQIKPLLKSEITAALRTGTLIVAEEANRNCGVYQELASHANGERVTGCNLADSFVTHGSLPELYREKGLSARQLADFAKEKLP